MSTALFIYLPTICLLFGRNCVFHILNKTFFVCVLEMVEAVLAVEEREVAECQSPGGEAEDGAAASSAASPSSDAPREPSSTSSPDTDSPVMINEDVSK